MLTLRVVTFIVHFCHTSPTFPNTNMRNLQMQKNKSSPILRLLNIYIFQTIIKSTNNISESISHLATVPALSEVTGTRWIQNETLRFLGAILTSVGVGSHQAQDRPVAFNVLLNAINSSSPLLLNKMFCQYCIRSRYSRPLLFSG